MCRSPGFLRVLFEKSLSSLVLVSRIQTEILGALIAFAMVLAGGCATVGPDYQGPPRALDEQGFLNPIKGATNPAQWNQFDDPVLPYLFSMALNDNLPLKEATWRITESRALVALASGQADPFADAFGTVESRKRSSNSQAFVGENGDPFAFISAGLSSRWEIDWFGRIQREVEAADAEYQATASDVANIRRILLGEIARAYVEFRLYQSLVEVNQANVQVQQSSLPLVKTRMEAGKVGKLDLVQLQSRISLTESDTPLFQERYLLAFNRLAVLLGQKPNTELKSMLGVLQQMPAPRFSTGVPADLLRRRADVRREERRLAAASARIGVEEAEFYPKLSLNGTLSLDSRNLTNLFDADSILYGIGPAVSWNILSLGRIERAIDIRHAQFQQAAYAYQQTVLTAVNEVESALVSFHENQKRVDILRRAKEEAQQAVELAEQQYGADRVSLERVLSNQRRLLRISLEAARVEANLAFAAVDLVQALGGDDNVNCVPCTVKQLQQRVAAIAKSQASQRVQLSKRPQDQNHLSQDQAPTSKAKPLQPQLVGYRKNSPTAGTKTQAGPRRIRTQYTNVPKFNGYFPADPTVETGPPPATLGTPFKLD